MTRKGRGLSLVLAWGVSATAVSAQMQTPAPPKASAAAESAAKSSADPVYQDRVIEGLQPGIEDADVAALADYNPQGWTRQLRFETRIGQDSFNNSGQRRTGGVALYGLIETPNHGVLAQRGPRALMGVTAELCPD